jgi:brefeldin A-resistance guanine nucleotide exchange factor 1
LKNILLVMADGGYLVSPSQDPSKEEIWVETRKRLGRFLPDLFSEIFPDVPNEPEKSPQHSTVSSLEEPRETEKATEAEKKSEETAPRQDSEGTKDAANAESQSQEAEKSTS